MQRNWRNIGAWQRAHELALLVYRYSRQFPKHELFGLTSQVRRSAVSAAANIVEGSGRESNKDYLHFLHISLGSLKETEYLVMLAQDLGYLRDEQFPKLTEALNRAFAALLGLQDAVGKQARVPTPSSLA